MPMRNGAQTFFPEDYWSDINLLAKPQSAAAIGRLRELGIRYVLLDTDNAWAGFQTRSWTVRRMPAALQPPYVPVFHDTNVIAYILPPSVLPR
jgi:hypothetical protein